MQDENGLNKKDFDILKNLLLKNYSVVELNKLLKFAIHK